MSVLAISTQAIPAEGISTAAMPTESSSTAKSPEPVSPPSMDQMVYSLAQISMQYEYRPSSPPPAGLVTIPASQKHMKMLNLLALLLVTGGSGDIAAISLRTVEKNRIELCYAKNRPCTEKETAYVSEFFRIGMNPNWKANTKTRELLPLVISNCKSKVISRIRKLWGRLVDLRNTPNLGVEISQLSREWAGGREVSTCAVAIREAVGLTAFPNEETLIEFTRWWFRKLLRKIQPNTAFDFNENEGLVYHAVLIAYHLTRDTQEEIVLEPVLLRRMSKLGDYCAAVSLAVHEMQRLGELEDSGISLKEVSQS